MALYCGNSECGSYLGSMGASWCSCGWEEASDEQIENAPSYIYCQGDGCGVYLGSMGGKVCGICNWNSYKEP